MADEALNTPALSRENAARLGYNDCVRQLQSLEKSGGGQPFRVAVLRSYTVEPIEPVLKFRLRLEGLRPAVWFGGYNQYVQEILDTSSHLYVFKPDLVLLLIRLEELIPDFVHDFGGQTSSEWSVRLNAAAEQVSHLIERLDRSLAVPALVQNATLSSPPFFGVFDAQRSDGQTHLVHEFNRRLAQALSGHPSAFVWDFDALVRAKGREALVDPKTWYTARSPFRQSAYPAIVDDLMRYVTPVLGRTAKCIALDLDNTLWGGVVGEDGLEGISLGQTYPGNCFLDFQRELLKLQRRGILLAVNSKNNEDDALRVIDTHPDMLLRRDHFAAMRINWQDKASNLRAIAAELNIGLDSIVFVDDNPVECELVRRQCPECHVVLLPNKPHLIPGTVTALPTVENIRVTDEDRQKKDMYRARTERRRLEESFTNLDEFLESLAIEVSVEAATMFSLPRIAQLTQKTNQMNMTTRRYSETQLQLLIDEPATAVYSVASKDRFGDDGIVGVFILKFVEEMCVIDTFLLSCRVIGRGIEQLMLAFIAELAKRKGRTRLIGEFFPTAKNSPAAGVYERAGLARGTGGHFEADLLQVALPYPAHLRHLVRI